MDLMAINRFFPKYNWLKHTVRSVYSIVDLYETVKLYIKNTPNKKEELYFHFHPNLIVRLKKLLKIIIVTSSRLLKI